MAVKKDMMRNWRPMVQRTPLAPRQFMVAFEWKDIDGKVHTASAWARRNNDQMVEAAFEVALTGEMLRTAAERMKILPNLGRDTREYIERYLTPLPADCDSRFITANAASLIVGITKTKKLNIREPGPSAYAMFRLKTKTGEVTIDKLGEHDELITDGNVEPCAPAGSLTGWLRNCSNVVLEGVPGTGKTHAINDFKTARLSAVGEGARPLNGVSTQFMTMHPSTSYEDFVEGLRPAGGVRNSSSNGSVQGADDENWFFKPFDAPKSGFAVKNGFFVETCLHAVQNPTTAVVVVLDELNRCNIPKVLGDLMTVIEESKRAHWNGSAWVVDSAAKAVTLPYSGRKLFVPDNLFIVGTMNTTDRSVAPMDAALRRRFSFHRIWPQGYGPDAASTAKDLANRLGDGPEITASLALWRSINDVLLSRYGADAMLGHSYLDDLSGALKRTDANAAEVVAYHWNHRILPQLMDVIASNGLTRSLVNDPTAFFGTSDKILDVIEVAVAGSGALRTAILRLKEPNTLVKGQQNVGDQSKAPVPQDNANGDE